MRGYMAFVSKIIRLLQRLIGPRRRPLRLGHSRLGAKWAIGLLLCLVCGACSTHRRTTEMQIKREETKAAHERLVFDSIRVRDTLLVRTERDTVRVERHVHYEHAVRQRLRDTLVVMRTPANGQRTAKIAGPALIFKMAAHDMGHGHRALGPRHSVVYFAPRSKASDLS